MNHAAKKMEVPVSEDKGIRSDHLSFSEFKTWRNCSAAGNFRYVRRLPSKSKDYLDFGNAVHGAVENYFKLRLTNRRQGTATEEEKAEAIRWAEKQIRISPSLRPGIKGFLELAEKLIDTYLDRKGHLKPLAVEELVEARIGDLLIRGKPDLIAVDENNQLVVVDYKTSRNLSAEISNDQKLQLTFYRILAREAFRWNIDHGEIHLFGKQKKAVVSLRTNLNNEDERALLHQIVGVTGIISAGIVFPNRGSEFCKKRFCDFAETCEKVYGGTVVE